ncbi:MAG TPA: hypothetical protein VLE97_09640 [Gaiellaceae bacterium]|nr:hypothetical protein [Gaiellaceae bacterium]
MDCLSSMRNKSTNKPIDLKALSGAINLDAESSSDSRVKMLGMVRARATAFGPAVEYSKAVEYRVAKLWGIDPKIEVGTVALRVEGEELTMQVGDRLLAARQVGDYFVFSGGFWGDHSLSARFTITTAQRLVAHWRGYCDNNARQYLDNGGVL